MGGRSSNCYNRRGRQRRELDELSRQQWEGPWIGVLILEVSATCSWEEKVIPFSVQVWPLGIENCIAPPVEGEEWHLDLDHGYPGEPSCRAWCPHPDILGTLKRDASSTVSKASIRFPFCFPGFICFPFSRSGFPMFPVMMMGLLLAWLSLLGLDLIPNI